VYTRGQVLDDTSILDATQDARNISSLARARRTLEQTLTCLVSVITALGHNGSCASYLYHHDHPFTIAGTERMQDHHHDHPEGQALCSSNRNWMLATAIGTHVLHLKRNTPLYCTKALGWYPLQLSRSFHPTPQCSSIRSSRPRSTHSCPLTYMAVEPIYGKRANIYSSVLKHTIGAGKQANRQAQRLLRAMQNGH
jgi:hypothetical protein